MIIHVFPWYSTITSIDLNFYVILCWSELFLYKPFQNIPNVLGFSNEEIIANRKQIKNHRTNGMLTANLNKWKIIILKNYFDKEHDWNQTYILVHLQETTTHLAYFNYSNIKFKILTHPLALHWTPYAQQSQSFNILLNHVSKNETTSPLKIIVQGIVGTWKLYLIGCIKHLGLTMYKNCMQMNSSKQQIYTYIFLLEPKIGKTKFIFHYIPSNVIIHYIHAEAFIKPNPLTFD